MSEQENKTVDLEFEDLFRKVQEASFNQAVREKIQSKEMVVETVDLNFWNKDEERMKKRKEKRHEKYQKVYEEVAELHYYEDHYYLTQEELDQYPELDKLFMELSKKRLISKNVAEYIRTFRLSVKCLKAVADENGVMPRDEFIEKYFAGDIDIDGLWAPEYEGRDKKFINWEVIDKYIADPEMDESIFETKTSKHKKDIYDIDSMSPEEYEETGRRLWGDEWDEIKKEKEDIKNGVIDYNKSQNDYEVDPAYEETTPSRAKETKKVIKYLQRKFKVFKHIKEFLALKEEEYRESHPTSKKKEQVRYAYGHRIDDITERAFRNIEEEDRRKGYKTGKKDKNQPPEFKGSFLKGKDYRKYQKKLQDWKDEHIQVYYEGKNRKLKDAKELDYWLCLESFGYNVRKIRLHIDEIDRNSIQSKMKRLESSLKDSKKKDKKAFEKARDYFKVEDEGKESQERMERALSKLKKGEDVDLETIDKIINAEKRRKYGRHIKEEDVTSKKKKKKDKDKKLKKKKKLPMINTKKKKEKKPKLKNRREFEENINRIVDDKLDPYGSYAARKILDKKHEVENGVVELTWDDIVAEYSQE